MVKPRYSIVLPVYNERENLHPLYKKLKSVMDSMEEEYEIIFVNDGSTDGSTKLLKQMAEKDPRVVALTLSTNYGQTPALAAGFDHARGEIVITMDADLQNDPSDIPRLIEKIDEGYDVVSGWRYKREDSFGKKFFSKISNRIANRMTGLQLHDYGCTLKAYRKEALDLVELYAELHRYIPAIISSHGYRVTELKVRHHARKRGKTKYGNSRLIRGPLDLVNLSFWNVFSTRPMHFFGGVGIASFMLGLLINAYLTFVKFYYNTDIGGRPLLLLGILLMVMGVQFLMFGFIGDMIVRLYYGKEGKKIYRVRDVQGKNEE